MPDSKARGVSNLPAAIPDIPDAITVSASNVGTSRAYNNGAATVTFTAAATGGLPSSYSITTTPTTATTVATISPAIISGLSSATSYTATVTPSNVSATGPATSTSSFTATTVPQAPTIGTFTDGGTGTSGTLSFTAGATGGSTITGYKYSTDGTNYSAASGTTSPFTLTGLSAGSYTFYLKATNANGDSAASSSVSGTVLFPYVGAYDSLATVTLSSSATSVVFAGIPSGYKHLQIRCFANITTADAAGLQFNEDTTSSYNAHRLYGTGTTAGAAASSGGASVTSIGLPATAGFPSATSTFGISIIDILDYQNVNKYKTVRGLSGWDGNGSGYVDFGSGLWRNTNAITSITYSAASGNFIANSSFALYGVK